jgi:hypothetical protein
MIMNAIVAVVLGLAPMQADKPVQTFQYRPADYAGLIGGYSQSTDKSGTTHLRGFDRITGAPFEIAVTADGRVEAAVGDQYITFTVAETS